MGRLRERLAQAVVAWSLEATPGIFFAVTLFGAFVFTAVTFSLALVAYLGTVGTFDASMACFLATLGPPAIVFVLWNVYRARLARFKFGAPPG